MNENRTDALDHLKYKVEEVRADFDKQVKFPNLI